MNEFVLLQLGPNQKLQAINKAHIISIEQEGDGRALINLSNGSHYHVAHLTFDGVMKKLGIDR